MKNIFLIFLHVCELDGAFCWMFLYMYAGLQVPNVGSRHLFLHRRFCIFPPSSGPENHVKLAGLSESAHTITERIRLSFSGDLSSPARAKMYET